MDAISLVIVYIAIVAVLDVASGGPIELRDICLNQSDARTEARSTMSILTTAASRKAAAQATEKRNARTFALVCVVICLSNLVLVVAAGYY